MFRGGLILEMTIKKITLAVFLAASCSLVWQFYRMHRASVAREIIYEESGWIICNMGPSHDEISRNYIEFLLLLAVVGSRLRGFSNTLLTVIGLTGATIVYIRWWQYVFELALNAEVPVQCLPHFMYLWGGNPLDLVIAVSIAALIVLNIRDAAHALVHGTS